MFTSNPNVGISSTIHIFAFNMQDFWYFSGNMYFGNTIKSRFLLSTIQTICIFLLQFRFIVLLKYILREKYQKYGMFFLQQFRFIVLPKYILPEKYQKSGMLKAKILIVEEIPTFGFDASNNMDF